MLVQLNITDFAIIRDLEIVLGSGLNILSGETGAGKSIIISAMNQILGGRASSDLIRSGCKEARVEALFSFPENRFLGDMLSDHGIPFDGELLIKRTVSREGRNRISINGSMATLQLLSLLSPALISISGQYEHQLLLKPDNHLGLLDDFGGLLDERAKLSAVFNRHHRLKEQIHRLKKEMVDLSEKQELARFQIQEIDDAGLSPDEDEALAEEKKRLQHAGEILEILSEGYMSLYESSNSVLSALAQSTKRVEKGSELDSRLVPIRDGLREVEVILEDLSFGLRDIRSTINTDPQRLEDVLQRLELLNRFKRKYGPTLSDVLQFRNDLDAMMYDLDGKKGRLKELETEDAALASDFGERAIALSKKRKKAARRLESAVEKELQYLHMKETRFRVKFEADETGDGAEQGQKPVEIRADGLDRVEFMISPNVGEDLRPLYKIASGGELSRIMLAIKTILARTTSVETVIFDEVDSGISGATAEVVGEKVLSLAQFHQIICITHLPQIASQGPAHFLVQKSVSNNRTHTSIKELDQEGRVREIARLLGGKKITPSAVAHAREMLGEI